MEDRKKAILKIFDGADKNKLTIIDSVIDDFIYCEKQLKELRELPFIQVNKSNPALQKITPAAKLYKDFLNQYSNLIKIMINCIPEEATEEDKSVITDFFKNQKKFMETRTIK